MQMQAHTVTHLEWDNLDESVLRHQLVSRFEPFTIVPTEERFPDASDKTSGCVTELNVQAHWLS